MAYSVATKPLFEAEYFYWYPQRDLLTFLKSISQEL